jgi:serine phosphatase RsbU (regulator of sigma subunit)
MMASSHAGSSEVSGRTPRPADLKSLYGLDVSARYYADRSGGDFFDAVIVGSRLIFLLTDIAGPKSEAHGIASEMQISFRQGAGELFAPDGANESEAIATLAHEVNRALIVAANGVRLAPTFLGCFNLTLGIMTYCNAGQVVAVFRDAESVHVLERGGVPLGLFTHVTYEPALLAFQPKDRLLLATKGIIQSHRGATEFGIGRLERILEQSSGDSAAKICDTVLREAYEFGNHPWARIYNFLHGKHHAHDDLTAVAMVR